MTKTKNNKKAIKEKSIGYRCFVRHADGTLASANGDATWDEPKGKRPGKWQKWDGPLEMCKTGFHFCKSPFEMMRHRQGEVPALVEVDGKEISSGDGKFVCDRMRVLKVFDPRTTWIRLAVLAARLVLPEFESRYPNDMRPRRAIEAAEARLEELLSSSKKKRE